MLTYALRLNSTPCEVRKASPCCRPLKKMSFFAVELHNTSHLKQITDKKQIFQCNFKCSNRQKKEKKSMDDKMLSKEILNGRGWKKTEI